MNKFNKIVAITASARTSGTGYSICKEILKTAKNTINTKTELINLYQEDLKFCTGCFQCMSSGSCYIKDSFETIKQKIYKADAVIFCAPTYAGSYNAVMKNFIDRLGMYEVLTSSLAGKYLVCLSTAGSKRSAHKTAKQIAKTLGNGCFGRSYISSIKGFSVGPDDNKDPKRKAIQKGHHDLAKTIGKNLVSDIKSAKKYPWQNLANRAIARFVMKPLFLKFIVNNKASRTKAVYQNLKFRGIV